MKSLPQEKKKIMMTDYEFSTAFKINLYFMWHLHARTIMFIISFICLSIYRMHNKSQAPRQALKIQ